MLLVDENSFVDKFILVFGEHRNAKFLKTWQLRISLIGLVINGLRLLDLAAEGDDRMAMVGDIDLDTKPLKIQRRSLICEHNLVCN